MKDLLEKLSSYNLFNNFLPGILFCIIGSLITDYKLIQTDVLVGVFLYYTFGIFIGRIGSIVVEPILRKMKIVVFSDYSDFVKASSKDEKLEILSETNNTYRSLISVVFCLCILKLYFILESNVVVLVDYRYGIIGLTVLVILILSYRKQTKYIKGRVESVLK
jgi:hypothetical protein